jgi:hypothetical protein
MDGTLFQGIKVEAIMNRTAQDTSIDFLSRVLVDVQLDSSRVLHDIISAYHRNLLDVIYMKDAANRAKFSLITAHAIHPKKWHAREYADRGMLENELKQVSYSAASLSYLFPSDKRGCGRGEPYIPGLSETGNGKGSQGKMQELPESFSEVNVVPL